MNIIDNIHNQQSGQLIRNSALRKAAKAPHPPKLTEAETTLINKKFTSQKSLTHYTVQGNVRANEFARGRHIDTRV